MTPNLKAIEHLPDWVPSAVRLYLTHTESGRSLRDIARAEGVHASTVLRQVRRFENRRDDPLVDCALGRLRQATAGKATAGKAMAGKATTGKAATGKATALHRGRRAAPPPTDPRAQQLAEALDENRLNSEALRVLRRMCEPGALLAVAADMDRAVVLRDGAEGAVRLVALDRPVAEAFALRDWIACSKPGRVAQYEITAAGRATLRRLLAETGESGQTAPAAQRDNQRPGDSEIQRARASLGETPVCALARRRDRDGEPFLTPDLVAVAEKLREDFEIAQMGPRVTQDWERFLTAGSSRGSHVPEGTGQAQRARARVTMALRELGPGLGDMALRCCCYLEGLETAEKRLGWSARSGKIVLRIALTRLKRHYDEQGEAGKMMG